MDRARVEIVTSADPPTVLELRTSFLIPFVPVTVVVTVDGREYVARSGTHRLDVTPGDHHIEIWYRHGMYGRRGEASITITIAPGEHRVLRWTGFMKGTIIDGAPLPTARVVDRAR